MDELLHPSAIINTAALGARTRVGAFSVVQPGARVGDECVIGTHVLVSAGAVIGDRVTIHCGAILTDGVVLEDHVTVGAGVMFAETPETGAAQGGGRGARTTVRRFATLGTNVTILPNVTVGEHAIVKPGAVVNRSVPPHAVVEGNPAKIVGYGESSKVASAPIVSGRDPIPKFEKVTRVTTHRMPIITDLRGSISVGEIGRNLPFVPKRYFTVFDVPGEELRGEHAHLTCHQFLVCIRGRVTLMVDDGAAREEIVLDTPGIGVHLPPMIWGVQYKYSSDAILLVLASEGYDAADYIRDHDEFLRLLKSQVR